MLTRLKVSGFKNLVDVDVRFGPFTCIAGANGVGKSNLFDAIKFLSALADRPLIEAAFSVRGSSTGIRNLFHRIGHNYTDVMSFEAEIIMPSNGFDDLGQEAKARVTFLRYSVALAYRSDNTLGSLGHLELIKEELVHINKYDTYKHLLFPHSSIWRKSSVQGQGKLSYFISTEGEEDSRVIKLHQDGSKGRPLSRLAINLPRTVLSAANASESPTALLARREMQSWRLLQLEPSALRKPDYFTAPTRLGADGSHLAATLYHLAQLDKNQQAKGGSDDEVLPQVYSRVANRLSELIDDVHEVWIDKNDQRELLTVYMTDSYGTDFSLDELSEGTVRFLALVTLAEDTEEKGVFCLEEPENSIHPAPIPAVLRLLQEFATDVNEPVGPDNPLRQVIVNTHSPAVVAQVPDDSLLVAESKEIIRSGQRFKRVAFGCLPNTWREKAPEGAGIVPKGKLLAYLNPIIPEEPMPDSNGNKDGKMRRVADRPDLQLMLPYFRESE